MLGRGSYVNTGYCPGTSRDANGYNRNFRDKEIFNVANIQFTLHSAETPRKIIKYNVIYIYVEFFSEPSLSFGGGFLYALRIFGLMIKVRRYRNGKKVHFTLAIEKMNRFIKSFLCILSRELGG